MSWVPKVRKVRFLLTTSHTRGKKKEVGQKSTFGTSRYSLEEGR